jgi:arsenate reductase-like glutaredoxin family protein
MEIQVFGTRKSADTRAALRFFAERRVKTHFVDLTVRPASPGELRRFAQRFGVPALVDRESKSFAALGLRAAALSDKGWFDKLAVEPLLLRQPLVRWGKELTIGAADDTWRSWVQRAAANDA